MKIVTTKENLLYGVQVAQRAVSVRNPLPILTGLLLKAVNGSLTITATDLELGIECSVPVSVEEEGGVVLPARYLGEIVRRLPEVKIEIEVERENNNTLIKYGNSEFNLLGISVEEFPLLPSIDSGKALSLNQGLFKNMIKQVGFAASADENRPIFTGILLEVEQERMTLVATDTHRLAYRSEQCWEDPSGVEKAVIIPGKALNELNRIMTGDKEELEVFFGENQVVFKIPGVKLISRLIEGQFPNYKQVLPQGCKTKIKARTRDFLEATERASLLAKEGANVVKVTATEGSLVINSNNPEIGRVEEQLSIELEGEGIQIAFNSRYLIDVLRVIDTEEILLELAGALSPGIIKPVQGGNYLSLILPIRLI